MDGDQKLCLADFQAQFVPRCLNFGFCFFSALAFDKLLSIISLHFLAISRALSVLYVCYVLCCNRLKRVEGG